MDNFPASYRKWYEQADAMNDVESLPHDDRFCEEFAKRRVRQLSVWTQDSAKPIAVESASLLHWLDNDVERLNELSGHSHVTVVKGCDIQVTNLPITDETGATDQRLTIAGSMNINGRELYISNLLDHVMLSTKDGELFELSPAELAGILITMAQYDDSHRGDLDESTMQSLLDQLSRAENDWQKLSLTVAALGNINGESIDRQVAVFHDGATEEAFVSQITATETPDQSAIDHFIQAVQSTAIFADQIGFDNHYRAVPDNTGVRDSELAFSSSAPAIDVPTFAKNALERSSVTDYPGSSRYSSKGDTARDYANICILFMNMYRRLVR